MSSRPERPQSDELEGPPAKYKTLQASVNSSSLENSSNGLSDFVIINDGQRYPVHKAVLSKYSDYFNALIEGATCMVESQTNEVRLQGISELAVNAVVKYMYNGTVQLCWSDIDDILYAASYLQMKSLIDECSEWLSKDFQLTNYRERVELARKYCLTSALAALNQELAKHFLELTNCRDLYFDLEADELIEMVSHDCLEVRSERELLLLLEQWLANSGAVPGYRSTCNYPSDQEDVVARLLSNVRFRMMSLKELQPLTFASHYPSEVNSLIQSAIVYHNNFPAMKPIESTDQNRMRSTKPSLVIVLENGVNKGHEILACHLSGNVTQTYSLYADTANQKTCAAVTVDNCLYTISLEHYGGFDEDSTITLRCFDPCIGDQRLLPCPELQVIPSGGFDYGNYWLLNSK